MDKQVWLLDLEALVLLLQPLLFFIRQK
jgi:hypothetical protein